MGPLKILIIEDDEEIRRLLDERLSRDGYDVRTAENGRAGLAQLQTTLFDAALIDIDLPDMTGIDVLEDLKRRDQEIDVVMMTGFPEWKPPFRRFGSVLMTTSSNLSRRFRCNTRSRESLNAATCARKSLRSAPVSPKLHRLGNLSGLRAQCNKSRTLLRSLLQRIPPF